MMNQNPFFSPNDKPAEPPAPNLDPGVSGGHFDSDIYDAAGSVKHDHEYDDKYDVTGVNFLAPSEPLFNVATLIPGVGTKFKILISNQKMSPAVEFSYGGLPYENVTRIAAYNNVGLTMASLPEFTRGNVQTLKYNMPKDAFEVKDWAGTGDLRVGLMPTQTGCVKEDKAGGVKFSPTGRVGPVPNLLHRNGAMTFQLVTHDTPDSAVELADAAKDPKYGYRVKLADRSTHLLAEWTVFWHHDNKFCLNDLGWVADPPPDLSPADPSKRKTPAAGSADPPRDTYGNVVGTTTNTVVDPDDASRTIRRTVTTYSTGIKVIIDEYIDSSGKVKKVVITTVSAGSSPPSGGSPGVGISQALSTANTVSGYQQTRSSGKLGRISWHELFAP
jgi:hypothetical protein